MAIFFDKVPLEIREKIYRELLVNEEKALEINWRGHCDSKGKHLYPAILRTCKQAWAEASAVLYEQNHFRHESHLQKGTSLHLCNPLKGEFKRVKRVSKSISFLSLGITVITGMISSKFLIAETHPSPATLTSRLKIMELPDL